MAQQQYETESTYDLSNDDEITYYDDDDTDGECFWCGGEGWIPGDEMGDPLWYDDDEFYRCPSCGGSGAAKDMTIW